jgi:hypothetical protein
MFAVSFGVLSDGVDPIAVGQDWMRRLPRTIDRVLTARAAIPAERVVDLGYRELMGDPVGVVRRIFAHFGHTLPPGTDSRLTAHLAANPPYKYGRHRYSLEQFGLAPGELDRASRALPRTVRRAALKARLEHLTPTADIGRRARPEPAPVWHSWAGGLWP